MKIQFLGAAGTVTGSKYLLESHGKRVLVDCGLFQGLKSLREKNWRPFPLAPETLDAVLLTHAHIDHSGYLPKLVKEGFRGPIFCTPATMDLCRILLPDAAYLMEEEAESANRMKYSKHHPALPLYTEADAEEALKLFRPLDFHETAHAGGFQFSYSRAGHILGAAHLLVEAEGKRVVFSGDVGRKDDPILFPPEKIPACDFLVVESTYGDRLHPPTDPVSDFETMIKNTVGRGGTVLIPAFAVGRAQHLLHALSVLRKESRIPGVPAYLDSPMAINVTELYRKYSDEHRLSPDDCERMCGSARYVRTADESRALSLSKEPCILISASGMATGGRVLHHLKSKAPKKENLILFAGYQAAGTRGAQMLAGVGEVKIQGEYIPIRAQVACLENFSAHGDYREILEWIKASGIKPRKIFVTHGELGAADAFRSRLKDATGAECLVPEAESSHSL